MKCQVCFPRKIQPRVNLAVGALWASPVLNLGIHFPADPKAKWRITSMYEIMYFRPKYSFRNQTHLFFRYLSIGHTEMLAMFKKLYFYTVLTVYIFKALIYS